MRQAFYGYEAQRIQRGKDDIRVMVRFPDSERRSLGDLSRCAFAPPTAPRYLSAAWPGPPRTRLYHDPPGRWPAGDVVADVNRDITPRSRDQRGDRQRPARYLARHPGVSYSLAGSRRAQPLLGSLGATTLLALLVIYALLAIPLKSYMQPLIIMSVIPFGAVGAIIGHLILGMPLCFFAAGYRRPVGVVVNSSLVLVDYINRQRHTGQSLDWVFSHAGSVRFGP